MSDRKQLEPEGEEGGVGETPRGGGEEGRDTWGGDIWGWGERETPRGGGD